MTSSAASPSLSPATTSPHSSHHWWVRGGVGGGANLSVATLHTAPSPACSTPLTYTSLSRIPTPHCPPRCVTAAWTSSTGTPSLRTRWGGVLMGGGSRQARSREAEPACLVPACLEAQHPTAVSHGASTSMPASTPPPRSTSCTRCTRTTASPAATWRSCCGALTTRASTFSATCAARPTTTRFATGSSRPRVGGRRRGEEAGGHGEARCPLRQRRGRCARRRARAGSMVPLPVPWGAAGGRRGW